jgi:hypothetical protein
MFRLVVVPTPQISEKADICPEDIRGNLSL